MRSTTVSFGKFSGSFITLRNGRGSRVDLSSFTPVYSLYTHIYFLGFVENSRKFVDTRNYHILFVTHTTCISRYGSQSNVLWRIIYVNRYGRSSPRGHIFIRSVFVCTSSNKRAYLPIGSRPATARTTLLRGCRSWCTFRSRSMSDIIINYIRLRRNNNS